MGAGIQPTLEHFLGLWGEVADLERASGLLSWDHETQMPSGGLEARGKLQGTLAGLIHERMTGAALGDALQAAEEQAKSDAIAMAQLREARRDVEHAKRIPASLAKSMAEATTLGHAAWVAARAAADFSIFQRDLERIIELTKEEAAHLSEGQGKPYDALLDKYEPGASEAELVPLFGALRRELSPLVRAVQGSGIVVDEGPVKGIYPAAAQEAFGRAVASQMGFDFERGRMDLATHPFCSGFDVGDVRITWRFEDDDPRPALFGIMHEAGHGLYEQGLRKDWQRTPLGSAVSLGMHESQSRLWENQVGRSRAFWEWALPVFKQHFPASSSLELDELYPALHTTQPSLIRVEADQGTYDLHVAARFELERAIFAGDLAVGDLPGAWDDTYDELLGLRAPDLAQGVLQDIHWSMGAFGYFPTYTLGNLMNAQLFAAAGESLGDLGAQFAQGDFAPLLGWLREHVHQHGRRFPAKELIERATGKPLSSEAFLAERKRTAKEIYGV